MRKSGFTLIELLIVVAIIAILAAIAIPNFLEALVRSKVTRTKAQLRTLAIGLEAYCVDKNSYPPDATYNVLTYVNRLKNLTTPVAYLTSLPTDPFADVGAIMKYHTTKGHNPYTYPPVGGQIVYPLTYDYACRRKPDGTFESNTTWDLITREPNSIIWAMRGIGPDKIPLWLGDIAMPYEPTNGTVSAGIIIWTGPGRGEDQPLKQ